MSIDFSAADSGLPFLLIGIGCPALPYVYPVRMEFALQRVMVFAMPPTISL